MPDNGALPVGRAIWRDKLRLIRKRWWKRYYSQNGEDVVLTAIFDGLAKGCYVDVGSFHPRRYSNTRLLYERGWWGINIDISPRKIALFDFDRPGDCNVCCAVSDTAGELRAYVFGSGSALDTTDRETADAWAEQFGIPYAETCVPSRTLTSILDGSGAPRVDYLNIDVEGAEIAVLNGLDFSRYRPNCITIEIHGDLEDAIASEAYGCLVAQGYEFSAWLRPTFFFTLSAPNGR